MNKLQASFAATRVALSCRARLTLCVGAWAALFSLGGCGGGGGDSAAAAAAPAPTLQSIAITPSNPALKLGATVQLVATATYSNSTTQVITSSVTWSSGTPAVAAVSSAGLVTPAGAAVARQTTVVTATSGNVTGTTTIAVTTFSIGTLADPLAAQQWGLRNTTQTGYADTIGIAGADINVDPVYNTYGYTGLGAIVAVVDSGLEIAHEDLAANVVLNGSWNFLNDRRDPTNTADTDGDHGTSVSGLIAMAMNGRGGIGVAPRAQLKGFNLIASLQTVSEKVASFGGSPANPNSSDVAIFNQSFGSSNNTDAQMNATVEAQYASGVSTLRSGKGALYVKSAGNGFVKFGAGASAAFCGDPAVGGATVIGVSCQNANFDPANTLPYNIVIAALNAKGIKSIYSTAGSAVWTSAPGGEYGLNAAVAPGILSPATAYDPAMVTTDQSGCTVGGSRTAATDSTFNRGGTSLASINSNCNYTNTMNGTSSAAPMMSGALALLLEANPALTWRDIKHILAKSARQVDAARAAVLVGLSDGTYTAEQAWTTNAAGYKFHNWYGFGAVDVSAAVALARSYVLGSLGTFANTGWISSGALAVGIPDNSVVGTGTAAGTVLTVGTVGAGGIVEAVQISVTLLHPTTGDLGIELTSPNGTKSILKNIQDGFTGNSGLNGMVLASNAFYGEPSSGFWTIKVIDGWAFDVGTLTNWQIRVYGH